MAPPTVPVTATPSQLWRRLYFEADAYTTQSDNPLGEGFNGLATTIVNAQDTGPLLLDSPDQSLPSGTVTASFGVISNISSTQLVSSPFSSLPSFRSSSQSPNGTRTGQITHEVLVGVTAVLSVIILAAICLLLNLYWQRRRNAGDCCPSIQSVPILNVIRSNSLEGPNMRRRKSLDTTPCSREVHIMGSEMRDPFVDIHGGRHVPAGPSNESRGTQDINSSIVCATDAGSVYALDREYIYGDNGASVKGILPPAYEDLPTRSRHAIGRDLPPLPPLPPRASNASS